MVSSVFREREKEHMCVCKRFEHIHSSEVSYNAYADLLAPKQASMVFKLPA